MTSIPEGPAPGAPGDDWQLLGAAQSLIDAVQRLSLARTIGEVQEIVRTTARSLCRADGATLVLRDGDESWYLDEDVDHPLFKGQRYPLNACICGWAILHGKQVVVPDLSRDDRIPAGLYDHTFVRSLAVVPIRSSHPIGAIGNYWGRHHEPSADEMALLQALSDSTAVALENVALWSESEERIAARSAALDAAVHETEQRLATLAHELRNAVGTARGLLELALRDESLNPETREDLRLAHAGVADGMELVDRQLEEARARASRYAELPDLVCAGDLLEDLARTYRAVLPSGPVTLRCAPVDPELTLRSDRHLLTAVLRNLVSNAVKFTDHGTVTLGAEPGPGEHELTLTVADTGIGIAPADRERIFKRFAQVDQAQPGRPAGTGLGLPYVREVVTLLGGRLELDSIVGRGTTLRAILPRCRPCGAAR